MKNESNIFTKGYSEKEFWMLKIEDILFLEWFLFLN